VKLREHLTDPADARDLDTAWETIQARRHRGPKRGVWVLGAAAVAALVVLVLRPGPSTPRAPLNRSAQAFTPEVVTADDGTQIVLMPGARLVPLESAADVTGWRLEQGAAAFDVPHDPDRTFYVRGGDVRVVVVGTRFTVRRAADQLFVEVDRGTVRVERDGDSTLVHGGDALRVEAKFAENARRWAVAGAPESGAPGGRAYAWEPNSDARRELAFGDAGEAGATAERQGATGRDETNTVSGSAAEGGAIAEALAAARGAPTAVDGDAGASSGRKDPEAGHGGEANGSDANGAGASGGGANRADASGGGVNGGGANRAGASGGGVNGGGASGGGANRADASGGGVNGGGANRAGASGGGVNGGGASGGGANRADASGGGANRAGASGGGANGGRANRADANGGGVNGGGTNGGRANRAGANRAVASGTIESGDGANGAARSGANSNRGGANGAIGNGAAANGAAANGASAKDGATAQRREGSDDDDPLAASDRARAAGLPERATEILARFVADAPDDPRVPLARFMLARVYREDLGDHDAAAKHLEAALAAGLPRPLEERALARLVESYVATNQRKRARAAAKRYVENFPKGARIEQIRRWAPPP
jgi:hypothetical protein